MELIKKVIGTLGILSIIFFSSTSANAQKVKDTLSFPPKNMAYYLTNKLKERVSINGRQEDAIYMVYFKRSQKIDKVEEDTTLNSGQKRKRKIKILKSAEKDIKEFLTSEQIKKYEQYKKDIRKKRSKQKLVDRTIKGLYEWHIL